ncbi:MAG: YihY/virulence factor BrkB family protein [Gemmatimonadota bacterium]
MRGLPDLVRETYDQAGADNVFFLASGLTFSLLMAAVPFLLLLVAAASAVLSPILALPPDAALDWIARNLPVAEQIRRDVWASLLEWADVSRTATPITAVLFLWFSTRLFGSLRHVLDSVFDLREGPGILRGKWIDVQLVVAATLLLLANVGVTTAFSDVSARVLAWSPLPADPILAVLSYPIAFLAIYVMFLLIYKFVPATSLGWRTAGEAALVASLGFEVVKYGLSLYLTNVADYSEIFSNLATGFLFVLSIYYTAMLFVLGAEVAKVLALRRVMRHQREVFDTV